MLNIITAHPLMNEIKRTSDNPTGHTDHNPPHEKRERIKDERLKFRHDYLPLSLPFFFPGFGGFASKIFRSSCLTFQREYSKRFISHSKTRPEYSENFPYRTIPVKKFDPA